MNAPVAPDFNEEKATTWEAGRPMASADGRSMADIEADARAGREGRDQSHFTARRKRLDRLFNQRQMQE